MYIQLHEDPGVRSFSELFTHTLSLIPQEAYGNLTTVLGPITAHTVEVRNMNICKIAEHEMALAESGWWVICLSTFQGTYQRLLRELDIRTYPREIIDWFIFPLIESGHLSVAHVRENYGSSFGTKLEHAKLIQVGVPIEYVS